MRVTNLLSSAVKCLQLQGGFAPLTRGSAPGPRWGHRPLTPHIGSRSALAIFLAFRFFFYRKRTLHYRYSKAAAAVIKSSLFSSRVGESTLDEIAKGEKCIERGTHTHTHTQQRFVIQLGQLGCKCQLWPMSRPRPPTAASHSGCSRLH